MPKMKTKKAVAARFKVTGTGKLRRNRPGKRHILTKKSPKRKRALGKPALVADTHLDMYKRLMGV
ncbi:MAG: 50S ribosomal protein L35 [Waddliaceae bacterium]|nr:50S ribosomal protein L35 [Waddliaceae bacterium]